MKARDNFEMYKKITKWYHYLEEKGRYIDPRDMYKLLSCLSRKDKIALTACLRQSVYYENHFELLLYGMPVERLGKGAFYRLSPIEKIVDCYKRADVQLVYSKSFKFVVYRYDKCADYIYDVDLHSGELLGSYPVIHYENGTIERAYVRDRDGSIL
nr:MAG TPA: hypothetical protein [Caudoviricetes sp.]